MCDLSSVGPLKSVFIYAFIVDDHWCMNIGSFEPIGFDTMLTSTQLKSLSL
jgi:hypothetical protein